MFRTIVFAASCLMPFVASAQSVAERAGAYQSWTVEQLCEARDDREAWAELKRRDLFDRRELRAISAGKVRQDIGIDALACLLGEPDSVDRLMTSGGEQLDAYTYAVDENEALVVHVYSDEQKAKVLRSMPASDAAYDPDLDEAYGGSCPEKHTQDRICAQINRYFACIKNRFGSGNCILGPTYGMEGGIRVQ